MLANPLPPTAVTGEPAALPTSNACLPAPPPPPPPSSHLVSPTMPQTPLPPVESQKLEEAINVNGDQSQQFQRRPDEQPSLPSQSVLPSSHPLPSSTQNVTINVNSSAQTAAEISLNVAQGGAVVDGKPEVNTEQSLPASENLPSRPGRVAVNGPGVSGVRFAESRARTDVAGGDRSSWRTGTGGPAVCGGGIPSAQLRNGDERANKSNGIRGEFNAPEAEPESRIQESKVGPGGIVESGPTPLGVAASTSTSILAGGAPTSIPTVPMPNVAAATPAAPVAAAVSAVVTSRMAVAATAAASAAIAPPRVAVPSPPQPTPVAPPRSAVAALPPGISPARPPGTTPAPAPAPGTTPTSAVAPGAPTHGMELAGADVPKLRTGTGTGIELSGSILGALDEESVKRREHAKKMFQANAEVCYLEVLPQMLFV